MVRRESGVSNIIVCVRPLFELMQPCSPQFLSNCFLFGRLACVLCKCAQQIAFGTFVCFAFLVCHFFSCLSLRRKEFSVAHTQRVCSFVARCAAFIYIINVAVWLLASECSPYAKWNAINPGLCALCGWRFFARLCVKIVYLMHFSATHWERLRVCVFCNDIIGVM